MSRKRRSQATGILLIALGIGLVCGGLGACGASIRSEPDYSEGIDPATGEPSANYSSEARIYGDTVEKRLEQARALARKREYPQAIAIFEEMAANQAIEEKYREGALFSLGEAQGAVFNPNKDYELGIQTLRRFLNLYPDSERAPEARTLIANYEQILGQL